MHGALRAAGARAALPSEIATAHTIVNVVTAILCLPLTQLIARQLVVMLPGGDGRRAGSVVGTAADSTPAIPVAAVAGAGAPHHPATRWGGFGAMNAKARDSDGTPSIDDDHLLRTPPSAPPAIVASVLAQSASDASMHGAAGDSDVPRHLGADSSAVATGDDAGGRRLFARRR